MTVHRFGALLRAALSRDPSRMRLKENNRCFRYVRHDFNPPKTSHKNWNTGYRFVIPECPANPETKPSRKMRISREFAGFGSRYRAVVRFGPTAIHTLATATDIIPVSTPYSVGC